ncbi:MAG TPA: SURF1 family protein [Rhodospirillaceae bacterium]|nr:surfeit locus 1 family protein [Rhodospirillaceae bacterium]HAT35998.1 SURF1 family protein [Rhodospirillaceae bacterium]
MAFRPTFWPTVITIPALIALIGFGTWQVQRLQWKEALIDKLQTRSTSAPIPLAKTPSNLNELEFQQVKVRGRFEHKHEFHLVNRSLNGNPGVHIITPFVRTDGGGAILINRGWVPFDKKPVSERPKSQFDEPVTVTGIVRLVKGQGTFTPDNDAKTNHWFFIDPAAMGAASGHQFPAGYYLLDGNRQVPGGFPVGHQWTLNIRNDHLQYAITWYAMALALLVIYILYHRKSE